MATLSRNTLVSACSTTAQLVAQAQFIEDTLVTTGGWVVTADTGQTPPASLTIVTPGPDLQRGYRIYRMNDALQSTYPVFMKLWFGTSEVNVSPYEFAITQCTIGTGSDGAGNITGVLFNCTSRFCIPASGVSSPGSTNPCNSYGSADAGRVQLGMFNASNVNQLYFSLERSKDSTGADTGAGLMMTWTPGGNASFPTPAINAIPTCIYINYSGGSQPGAESGLNFILTVNNPTQSFGGNIGVGLVSHFYGYEQQPGLGTLVVHTSDIAAEVSFPVTIYGVAHTYMSMNVLEATIWSGTAVIARSDTRIAMRYD
jgi:hypothetical protein